MIICMPIQEFFRPLVMQNYTEEKVRNTPKKGFLSPCIGGTFVLNKVFFTNKSS